jgi:hypothetical protein
VTIHIEQSAFGPVRAVADEPVAQGAQAQAVPALLRPRGDAFRSMSETHH